MEEVQSWWEVPSVAHFCYVFRSAFNLFFFEIAELESSLLNIQDPDMSISLEQLIIKLLQGFSDDESVNEENWEEILHDLFRENLDDNENPFDGNSSFFQLTPRSKVEVLFKLCELRLDIEGAMEEIKNIPAEDMQAKCIGKDKENNIYWYFCDERLYKEDPSSGNKSKQLLKNKNEKNTSNKKQVSGREKRNKASLEIDKSWTIACHNISDWEKLIPKFAKSKSTYEKELSGAMKDHLPVLQERVAEKDRLLRKRYLELAPKRSSSRISKVQEKKKMDELKAAEEARRAKVAEEKERARKESLMLKMQKESRQKRAEERHKAIEERAVRAKLRELSRNEDSDTSDDEDILESVKNYKRMSSRTRKTSSIKSRYLESESEVEESEDNVRDVSNNNYEGVGRRTATFNVQTTSIDNRRNVRTYSNYRQQLSSSDSRASESLQRDTRNTKCNSDSDESEKETNSNDTTNGKETSSRFEQLTHSAKVESFSDSSGNTESSSAVASSPNNRIKINIKNRNRVENSVSKQSLTLPNNYTNQSHDINNRSLPPKITVYKAVLQNASDVSKWNSAIDPKRQKLHILHKSFDNLASKRIKLEQVNFKAVSPNMKSSLAKENQIYKQTAFITYGKITPSPSIVKLQYRKPPNPPVSS